MSDQAEKTALDYLQVGKLHSVDETQKPKWAIGLDGRHTDISRDERFDGLFAEWQADACKHERTGIIRWVNGGSQTCYNWFCAHCGGKLSSNIPHVIAQQSRVEKTSKDELASRTNVYVGQRQEHLAKIVGAAGERTQAGNREEYDDYLRSERWQALRAKIVARAGGKCEGCLSAYAEHVHHLSYAHRGNEFAFELLAVCQTCHERLHDREAAE